VLSSEVSGQQSGLLPELMATASEQELQGAPCADPYPDWSQNEADIKGINVDSMYKIPLIICLTGM